MLNNKKLLCPICKGEVYISVKHTYNMDTKGQLLNLIDEEDLECECSNCGQAFDNIEELIETNKHMK